MRPATDWLGNHRIYAHRGLHHPRGPLENSLPAFDAAIRRGLGIECDVQISEDGVAMVFHDWTLDRLTDRDGPVRARPAAELETIPLLLDSGAIPRLETALRMIAGRAPLLIELKSRRDVDWRPLARAVARALAGYSGPAAVMSFDPRIVFWMRRHLPNRPCGLVTGRREWRASGGRVGFGWQRALAIATINPDFIACDLADLPDPAISRLRRRGMKVLGWTARDPALVARAARNCDGTIAEGQGIGAHLPAPE